MTKEQFRSTAATADDPPVVTAVGEIDLANLDEFQAVLRMAAADSPTLTVDLTQTSYCDSAGLRALFTIAATTQLTVLAPSGGTVLTVLRIAGLDRVATVVTVG
jgi:anti-anti-sigma factor